MAKWPNFTATIFPELGIAETVAGEWRYVTTDSIKVVGPIHKSAANIWGDLKSYHAENWAERPSTVCPVCGK